MTTKRMSLRKAIEKLEDIARKASLESASFGFPQDRIEIKSVHHGAFVKGQIVHPTEYIRELVRIHHDTWIIGPLNEVIEALTSRK